MRTEAVFARTYRGTQHVLDNVETKCERVTKISAEKCYKYVCRRGKRVSEMVAGTKEVAKEPVGAKQVEGRRLRSGHVERVGCAR